MRFEGGESELAEPEQTSSEYGNRWYFFVPVVMVVTWLVIALGRVVAFFLAPDGSEPELELRLGIVMGVVDWFGGIGWILLFLAYFVVVSHKRASALWALGAFCVGPNLLLYVALLLLPVRTAATTTPAVPSRRSLAAVAGTHPSLALLENSFACESCDAVLNFGVSECDQCGARYEYTDGDSGT
jgi:hypothetical protein